MKFSVSETPLRENLQTNFNLCLTRLLTRLLLFSGSFKSIEIVQFLTENIINRLKQAPIEGKFQEMFCLGILTDHLLSQFSLNNRESISEIDLTSLSQLLSTLSIAPVNNFQTNESKVGWTIWSLNKKARL